MLSSVKNPGLASGVIDAAGPFNTGRDLKASYAATLKWATSTANTDAIAQLKGLGPPPFKDFSGQITLSTWASQANGGLDTHLSESKLVSREPFTTLKPEWQDTQISISKTMYAELERLNVEPGLKAQRTPLLVIVGTKDAIVPPDVMRAGYNAYGGRKHWVELSESHHLSFVDEPDAFVKAVVAFAR
jgi:pimeloyl-ACP methyl ester carboxylesterase